MQNRRLESCIDVDSSGSGIKLNANQNIAVNCR